MLRSWYVRYMYDGKEFNKCVKKDSVKKLLSKKSSLDENSKIKKIGKSK